MMAPVVAEQDVREHRPKYRTPTWSCKNHDALINLLILSEHLYCPIRQAYDVSVPLDVLDGIIQRGYGIGQLDDVAWHEGTVLVTHKPLIRHFDDCDLAHECTFDFVLMPKRTPPR